MAVGMSLSFSACAFTVVTQFGCNQFFLFLEENSTALNEVHITAAGQTVRMQIQKVFYNKKCVCIPTTYQK